MGESIVRVRESMSADKVWCNNDLMKVEVLVTFIKKNDV